MDFFSAISKDDKSKAAAPSFIPEEFPGVTVPFSLKTVLSFSNQTFLNLLLDAHPE